MIDFSNEKIMEKVKEIPFYGDYDVVVAGGGVAGFGAAVAVGKRGYKVLLIEATSALGGLATMGLVNIPLDFVSGIGREMMDELEARFDPFLRQNLPVNPLKCEYFLPFVPDCLIRENKGSVQVLKTHDRWYGMTYREDLPSVREALKELRESGLYPENLWR